MCCGSYYCDECFYKLPQCRFCEAPVVKVIADRKGFATVCSILLSWLVTIFFILIVIAFAFVMSSNETSTKIMMSGYKCYGLFKECTVDICAEVDPLVAPGLVPLTALSEWKPCNLESTVKINTKACIFDPQLYFASTEPTLRNDPNNPELVGVMGYDVCLETFQNGVYIFEDMFEAWSNVSYASNSMKSSHWQHISNAFATPYCGSGQHLGGKNSLVFGGEGKRFAETKDLDISSGGWLEAELFVSPVGFDVSNPFCKSSYSGGIYVEYSLDSGSTWVVLQVFDAFVYRQEKFFPIKFSFPIGHKAASSRVRFRFYQRDFTAARDQWALDNVRVLRSLPAAWHELQGFVQNVEETVAWLQKAQCCFDTDWCQTRLSLEDMDKCKTDFRWYSGRRYLLRGSELYVIIIVFVCIAKFLYTSAAEYVIRGRLPFQNEFEDLAKIDRFTKYLPVRYRPRKSIESLASNIHMSARLGAELMDTFKDQEGTGEAMLTKDDQEKQRRAEAERLRKEAKSLKKRSKKKGFQSSSGGGGGGKVAVDDHTKTDTLMDEEEGDVEEAKGQEMPVPVAEMDAGENAELTKFKQQNVGLLRHPFDTRVDTRWTSFFRNYNFFLLALFTLIKLGTTSYYEVHQPLLLFGQIKGDMSLTSIGVFFLAFVCDLRDVYLAVKNVVPCRPEWVPYITIDLQDDISALFIGEHVISIKDIGEIVPFPLAFALANALGFFLGCFPWCLFAIILRDQFLEFSKMRIVTPALAIIALLRAVLGPSFVIRIVFSFYYLFGYDPKIRERVGVACQAEKTRTSALTGMLLIGILAYIIGGIVANDLATDLLGYGIAGGLLYGALTGCVHGLPIRPWMLLTCLRQGVWMRVKKKQSCPCIYWGSFCTDMHISEEVFIVYTTDDVKFLSLLKGGAGAGIT